MDNIKKIISAALIMLTLSGVAPAQTDSVTYKGPKTSDYPRHELGVSYGLFPIIGVVPYGKYEKYKDLHPFIQGDIIWSGSANVYYRCWFNRHNSLSLDFSWAMYKHQSRLATDINGNDFYHSPTDIRYYRNTYVHYFSVQFGYNVHYYTTEKVTLYSSLFVGFTTYYYGDLYPVEDKHSGYSFAPSLHVNFLGLSVGKNNAATFELGYGTQGVLKFGYNYRF